MGYIIGFIVIGIVFLLIIIVPIGIFAERQRKAEQKLMEENLEKEKEFDLWLAEQGFVTSDETNGFLVDTANKKWCKKFEKKIFDFTDATGASINKHRSSKTSTSGSSSSRGSRSSSSRRGFYTNSRYGSGSSGSSRSSSSTRTSEDTSTYEVLIKTTDIGTPLVTIDCYRDKASAEKICATVDIMRGKKTRNRTKENDDSESEIAD